MFYVQFGAQSDVLFDILASKYACIEYASHSHAFVLYLFAVSPVFFVAFSSFSSFAFFFFALFSFVFVFFSSVFAAVFGVCNVDFEF